MDHLLSFVLVLALVVFFEKTNAGVKINFLLF